MKRKIFVILCALCLVLSFSVTAFASEIEIPKIELDTQYLVIYSSGGVYKAVGYDTYTDQTSNNSRIMKNGQIYELIGSKWVFQEQRDITLGSFGTSTIFHYDNTGYFPITNPIKFISPIGFDDFTDYYSGLKGQVNVKNVVSVLAVGAGVVVGIVFMWWGVRKAVRALITAFRKGKVSL